MADANAEIVRRGVDAYNRGDVEAVLEMCDPEVTLVPVKALLEGGGYSGHEGVRRFMRGMEEDWASREVELEEIRDLGDRVLVIGQFHAVGRSGVELRQPVAWLNEFRDGTLVRMQAYSDPGAALAELGLE